MDNDKNVHEFKSSNSAVKEYSSVLQSWLYYVLARNENSYCYILDLSLGNPMRSHPTKTFTAGGI